MSFQVLTYLHLNMLLNIKSSRNKPSGFLDNESYYV